ncbi:hypothetical protein DY000_02031660 [Brassica cretica]|uniref:Uncharacterized protein n=1 Tax=Brassica cretica TaxID=69181 RepID=A0ABQ7DR28_BRACR|nr:hypothetical protein DY000_02031660 [Brassica cretica]
MESSTLFAWGPCRGRLGRGQCIPGPFGTPILGGLILSPLLLESCFLFSGFLDKFMDITVVPHFAAVPQCSHTPTFCLAGGLSRRPSDPSCCSFGRACPCNSGILGRHPVDKRRSIRLCSTQVRLPTEKRGEYGLLSEGRFWEPTNSTQEKQAITMVDLDLKWERRSLLGIWFIRRVHKREEGLGSVIPNDIELEIPVLPCGSDLSCLHEAESRRRRLGARVQRLGLRGRWAAAGFGGGGAAVARGGGGVLLW